MNYFIVDIINNKDVCGPIGNRKYAMNELSKAIDCHPASSFAVEARMRVH